MSTLADPNQSPQDHGSQKSPPLGAIIGGAVGAALVVIGIVLLLNRDRIQQWRASRQRQQQDVEHGPPMTETGGQSARLLNQTQPNAGQPDMGNRPRTRFRYNQRHDSGRSVKSVPEYSLAPTDDELVLMKPRDSVDLTEDVGGPQDDELRLFHSRTSSNESDASAFASGHMQRFGSQDALLDPPSYVYRSRASSAADQNLPQDPRTLFDTVQLHHGLASASVLSLDIPRPSGDSSRPSLEADISAASKRRSFFRHKGPSASTVSLAQSLSQSQNSASSLVISAPIRDTLIIGSSNYVYPKKGITPEQMSFISSRENLALMAVRTNNDPPAFEELPAPVPLVTPPMGATATSEDDEADGQEDRRATIRPNALTYLNVPLPDDDEEELEGVSRRLSQTSFASTATFATTQTHLNDGEAPSAR